MLAGRDISAQRDLSDGYFWKWRLGAATVSDILYLFGQGNFIFVRGKSGNFEKLYSAATRVFM